MKKSFIKFITISVLVLPCMWSSLTAQTLKGDYLGQELPGNLPVIFAAGIISTEENELNSVFSCDGNEFYFSRGVLGTSNHLYVMKRTNNVWSGPQLSVFSDGVDPGFSPGCRRIYFSKGADIFFSEKLPDGSWSEPKDPGGNINTSARELYSCIVADGSMYFMSSRTEGAGGSDIYRAQFKDGVFMKAENIGPPINSEYGEGDVFVTPDEKIMVFSSSGRPDSRGAGDLYVSFRLIDGKWSSPKNLGENFNSSLHEYCPVMTPDGKFLFYSSRRDNNQGDIYWVSSKVLKSFR